MKILSNYQQKLVDGIESRIGYQAVEKDRDIRYFSYQDTIVCMVNDTLKVFKTYVGGYNRKYAKQLGERYAKYFLSIGYTREQELDD